MNKAGIEQLIADHPKVIYMTTDEMFSRYWMYDSGVVARARAQVYMNRYMGRFLARIVNRINSALTPGGNA